MAADRWLLQPGALHSDSLEPWCYFCKVTSLSTAAGVSREGDDWIFMELASVLLPLAALCALSRISRSLNSRASFGHLWALSFRCVVSLAQQKAGAGGGNRRTQDPPQPLCSLIAERDRSQRDTAISDDGPPRHKQERAVVEPQGS